MEDPLFMELNQLSAEQARKCLPEFRQKGKRQIIPPQPESHSGRSARMLLLCCSKKRQHESGRLSHSIRKAVTAVKTDSGSPICTIPSTKEPS